MLPYVPLVVLLFVFAPGPAEAQVVTTVRGTVRDEVGAALPGVTVTLRQPSSGLERTGTTDAVGHFEFANLPAGVHDLAFDLPGFARRHVRVEAHTSTPAHTEVSLALAPFTDGVEVAPLPPPVDTTSAGTRHSVSQTRIERLPAAVSSRGLESVLVSFPGFAQNANGAIHPRGAHNQMTYVVDGLPISDQLTGAFANSLDVGVVQTAEVLTGNIPAEFGAKVSGVAVLNSRSGLGTGRELTGTASASAGGFATAQGTVQAGGQRGKVGYFGSATAMRTDRFLDQVSLDNLHNGGHFARGFGRVDLSLTERDALRVHAMGGASQFEIANLRSQQEAGQDQRQSLGDVSAWAAYLRTIDAVSTLEATAGYRRATAALQPSAGDTPVTAAQERELSTYTVTARYTRSSGPHVLRAGVDLQRFPVAERFAMGLTSPDFNVPGSEGFNEALLPYDLTRGGSLFVFDEANAGTHAGAFVQATLQWPRWSVNAGVRQDEYRFLVSGRQLQPRVGVAYRPPLGDVVVRASYNRNYQTPPNENLLLSSSEAAARLAPASVRDALGGAYRPIHPERQDVVEAGVQFSAGRRFTVDASVYRKQSDDQQDNNNFFDTGIIFPTTLRGLRVTGAEARVTLRQWAGLSGALSVTTGRAIATPPFTGGLFLGQDAVDLLSSGPFAIDHDQRLGVHGTLSYDPEGGWWFGGSVRYDSGLVSNPSDPAEVAADPDFADLLPYVDLDAETPRVRPRTIADVAVGYDVTGSGGRRVWGVQASVTNVAGAVALYNFQSVFVGTRLVQPRTASVRVTRYF